MMNIIDDDYDEDGGGGDYDAIALKPVRRSNFKHMDACLT